MKTIGQCSQYRYGFDDQYLKNLMTNFVLVLPKCLAYYPFNKFSWKAFGIIIPFFYKRYTFYVDGVSRWLWRQNGGSFVGKVFGRLSNVLFIFRLIFISVVIWLVIS